MYCTGVSKFHQGVYVSQFTSVIDTSSRFYYFFVVLDNKQINPCRAIHSTTHHHIAEPSKDAPLPLDFNSIPSLPPRHPHNRSANFQLICSNLFNHTSPSPRNPSRAKPAPIPILPTISSLSNSKSPKTQSRHGTVERTDD